MHDIIDKTPRLFRVSNEDTREVFTIFATSKSQAVSLLPLDPGDTFTIDEVMVTETDGSKHNIFQLRSVPAACSGTFFKTVNCNTLNVGKTVWLKQKGDYDPSTRKYCCIAAEDISKSREFKPGQWVITTFTY